FEVALLKGPARKERPSRDATKTIAATANSIRPSVDRRIAVRPAQIASRVMKLGTSIRIGIGRNRRRRISGYLGSKGCMAWQYIASPGPFRHCGALPPVRQPD